MHSGVKPLRRPAGSDRTYSVSGLADSPSIGLRDTADDVFCPPLRVIPLHHRHPGEQRVRRALAVESRPRPPDAFNTGMALIHLAPRGASTARLHRQ